MNGAAALGVPLTMAQIDQFDRYGKLLQEWNLRLNLTRVPPAEFVTLHYLDSLAAARVVDFAAVRRLIDVGTGAGLPGIPLKLAYPHLDVTLLDSTRKKLAFLDTVIAELGLRGIRTLHARAEDVVRLPAHRGRYDVAIARAVARLPQLLAWLLPLVQPGGYAVALKSSEIEEELAEARRARSAELRTEEVSLPGTEIVRVLVVARKGARRP